MDFFADDDDTKGNNQDTYDTFFPLTPDERKTSFTMTVCVHKRLLECGYISRGIDV